MPKSPHSTTSGDTALTTQSVCALELQQPWQPQVSSISTSHPNLLSNISRIIARFPRQMPSRMTRPLPEPRTLLPFTQSCFLSALRGVRILPRPGQYTHISFYGPRTLACHCRPPPRRRRHGSHFSSPTTTSLFLGLVESAKADGLPRKLPLLDAVPLFLAARWVAAGFYIIGWDI
jgi:hypothetical protein